jgi:hypothetical protein
MTLPYAAGYYRSELLRAMRLVPYGLNYRNCNEQSMTLAALNEQCAGYGYQAINNRKYQLESHTWLR